MLLLDRSKCRPAARRQRTTFPPSYARNAIAGGPSGGAAGAPAGSALGPGGDHMPGGCYGVIIGGQVKQRWCRTVPATPRAIA